MFLRAFNSLLYLSLASNRAITQKSITTKRILFSFISEIRSTRRLMTDNSFSVCEGGMAAVPEGLLSLTGSRLVDSHCHLQLEPLFDDADAYISRAKSAGIVNLVVCGVCPGEDWERVAALYSRHSTFLAPQFGLHPWWISKLKACSESNISLCQCIEIFLENALSRNENAGVGECGLDKCIRKSVPLTEQESVLRVHFEVAHAHNRPITLHCVGAWGRLLECIQTSPSVPAIVLHSCNSLPIDMLPHFLAQDNVYFSLNGKQLGEKERPLLLRIPLCKLLIETDSPDQLPTELGNCLSSNEPSVLAFVCSEIAKLRSIDANSLAAITSANAQLVYFGLKM